MGNSEKGTGNWCFNDGVISFEDVFSIHRKVSSAKCLMIVTDCNYAGQWLRECAKTLDNLQVPPCGHGSREHGAMVKVLASCLPDQEATEPCYSVEALTVREDGSIAVSAKQLAGQKSTWFDATRLVCCRDPSESCLLSHPGQLTWEGALNQPRRPQLIKRKEENVPMWYCILLKNEGEEYYRKFQCQQRKDSRGLQPGVWGHILKCGEGENLPQTIKCKVVNWTCVTY